MTGPAPGGPAPGGAAAGAQGRLVGVVEQAAPGVRRILAPNPGIMTGPGTNTYLVGDGPVAVIDPGPDDDAHMVAILEAVGDRLRFVIATHTHVDHSPLARRLKEATGAQVVGFGPAPTIAFGHSRATARQSRGADAGNGGDAHDHGGDDHGGDAHGGDAHDRTFDPDRRMGDGDRLRVGTLDLVAVHTPGHCSNHLCFELAGTGLLFSGDHVMSGSTVVIAPPDGDMADYMEALERVRALHPTRIAPGHGGMIDDPTAVLDGYLSHRRARESQVAAGVAGAGAEGTTAARLVSELYSEVPAALHPVAEYSVWAHLRKLQGEGRISSDDPDDPSGRWRSAPPG